MINKISKIVTKIYKNEIRYYSRKNFDKFNNDDWSKDGSLSALFSMNKVRVPWIINKLNINIDNDKKLNILDIGCGAGILTMELSKYNINITGIDESKETIEIAIERAKKIYPNKIGKNLNFDIKTPDLLYYESDIKYDAIIISEVVEHVDNVAQFIYDCCNLCKINGYIFITTINKTLLSLIFAKFAAEYILKIVPMGIHSWNKFISPIDLSTYLLGYGMENIEVNGLCYNPFNNTWKWSNNKSMNYALFAQKSPNPPIYEPYNFS